ncbi:hypothetical protein RRG08_039961 [Elysia crispata]|uniref:Uncharacterized protein n=1 Tax=Elysia crispata TaxID=231223 RepID=A0AAE0Z821_9GAST|nr:hypothetical protein RRG08_039961 [Elysia crispata]
MLEWMRFMSYCRQSSGSQIAGWKVLTYHNPGQIHPTVHGTHGPLDRDGLSPDGGGEEKVHKLSELTIETKCPFGTQIPSRYKTSMVILRGMRRINRPPPDLTGWPGWLNLAGLVGSTFLAPKSSGI